MNIREFNERFGPEWKLYVYDGKVGLENIVPLYKMALTVAEWDFDYFSQGVQPPWRKVEEIHPNWDEEGGEREVRDWEATSVHPDAMRAAERVRVFSVWGKHRQRLFNVSTNAQLESAALTALKWLWDEEFFPEPEGPKPPGFTLSEIEQNDSIPAALKAIGKNLCAKFVELKQAHKGAQIIYEDVRRTLEQKNAAGAWCILLSQNYGKIDFLE